MGSSDATVPWEAFDPTLPDHEWWVNQTGRCLAEDCPVHDAALQKSWGEWVKKP